MGVHRSFFNAPEGQAVSGRRYGSSPQIGKIQFGYVSGQQDIRVQINDPAVLREQAAGHQAGIRKGGVAVLVAVLKELAEFFRKLQERKGNLRKGGGDPVQLLYYSRVHSVVNDVNVIKASGTGVKAKGVNGYAQGQAPAAGGGKEVGDACLVRGCGKGRVCDGIGEFHGKGLEEGAAGRNRPGRERAWRLRSGRKRDVCNLKKGGEFEVFKCRGRDFCGR